MNRQKFVLPVIVIAQFCCTSLWFASNGVLTELVTYFQLKENILGPLTSVVQFGLITGTLIFAILSIADRFSPSKVFLVCGSLGALTNLGILYEGNTIQSLLILRMLTGFFLAGIYPVGMKIAADYFEQGLGKSLGYLVGALVVGTAFPHLLNGLDVSFSWKFVIITTSILAVTGGISMILFVPDGPFRKPASKLDLSAFFKVFGKKPFRQAAFGYFGHMWELYAFWAFVPVLLTMYQERAAIQLNIPVLSFLIIGIGGLSCVMGAFLAKGWGTKRTAFIALLLSCLCCFVSPFMIHLDHAALFILFLLFLGYGGHCRFAIILHACRYKCTT